MEVGAVKQAFNNEVIQLKRNLNQAKIQTIHKLTRKAKTLTEKKKCPDKLKEKLKRKAESAVNEVLIMKKIKPKVIAKFAVTHKGNLQDYLNKPIVDQDKVCARLLLHKSLQEKYNYIRNTFSNISINDLLMSRLERRKMKKDAMEMQKMKRDKKMQKVVNAEGDWEVENLKTVKNFVTKIPKNDEVSGDDENMESDAEEEANSGEEREPSDNEEINYPSDDEEIKDPSDDEEVNDEEKSESEIEEQDNESDGEVEDKMETDEESKHEEDLPDAESDDDDDDDDTNIGKFVKPSPVKEEIKPKTIADMQTKNAKPAQLPKNKKPEIKKPIKPRDPNKNKKLNEKLISRNFKKDSSEAKFSETKTVDPFFKTSTGENYMTVAEARQPDEVKEVHKQGNRQMRRAVMFGHVPKIKPRKDFKEGNYNRQNNRQNDSQGGFRNSNRSGDGNYNNNYNRNDNQFKGRNDSQYKGYDNKFQGRNDNQFRGKDSQFKGRNDSFKGRNDSFRGKNDAVEPKVEKLHPSWEAKKKKSGLLPFQGKKIVFDES